ncbi:MAG: hypothetical protein DRN03_01105 [Thermoplasmata archaeon]|nr:MAG: hypothetical protein DRN03_01105 [Thermoplasmata archaeon]
MRARWGKRELQGYYPVSFLLTAEQYEGLCRLVDEGRYKNLSEALRAAVDAFLEHLEQEGSKAREE